MIFLHSRLVRVAATMAMALAGAAHVGAQTPAAPAPPPFREGTVDFALLATTGNSSALTLGLGGDVTVRPMGWVVRNRANFLRAETDDTLTAQSFVYLFRAERALSQRLSAFGQYNYLRDRFAGIEHKNTVTGGLSYQLVDRAPHSLKVLAGLGYTDEQRVESEPGDEDDISSGVLLTGWEYKLRISETAEFSDELAYEQAFSSGDQWRLDHLAAVTARLTTLLSLKLSHRVRYVHRPPTGVESRDTATAVALVAKF